MREIVVQRAASQQWHVEGEPLPLGDNLVLVERFIGLANFFDYFGIQDLSQTCAILTLGHIVIAARWRLAHGAPPGSADIDALYAETLLMMAFIDYVLEKEGDVAAVIAEPVSNTAVNPPPPEYWQAVRRVCDRHGALLVFDETAVCLGRTGRMFAFQHFDVVPDIVTLGKGLGGGVIPFAAMIARRDLDVAPEKGLGHCTHEKNPVAAALATIAVIEEDRLVERVAEMVAGLLHRLKKLQRLHAMVAMHAG
jgi:4-aminobutyrate aminotransferase-like enzyme